MDRIKLALLNRLDQEIDETEDIETAVKGTDDIFMSINHILNNYDYEGRYASDNGKSYK